MVNRTEDMARRLRSAVCVPVAARGVAGSIGHPNWFFGLAAGASVDELPACKLAHAFGRDLHARNLIDIFRSLWDSHETSRQPEGIIMDDIDSLMERVTR